MTRVLAESGAARRRDLRGSSRAGARHNGFNLLGGDVADAHWGSNRSDAVRALAPGIHGLSNHLLDTPWPKVVRTKAAVAAWCARPSGERPRAAVRRCSRDRTAAPDADLPATGIPLDRERLLSAPFIVSDGYGTRCSTLLAIARDGTARFVERSFDPAGRATGEVDVLHVCPDR